MSTSQLGEIALDNLNADLATRFDAEVVYIRAPIRAPLDDLFRIIIESLLQKGKTAAAPKERLCVFLETTGGYIETVQRLVGDATRWHSHGRGITMKELMNDDIKLLIDDFGQDEELSNKVRHYHGLAVDIARQQRVTGFMHTRKGIRRF